MHRRPHVRVERGHRLRRLIDDGHRDAPSHKCLGHFHADVPSADHDGPPGLRAIEIRQERRTIAESLHAEHADSIRTGQLRSHRDRACGDDQGVEALPVRSPGGKVTSSHPTGLQVDLLDLGSHTKVDAVAPVLLR